MEKAVINRLKELTQTFTFLKEKENEEAAYTEVIKQKLSIIQMQINAGHSAIRH